MNFKLFFIGFLAVSLLVSMTEAGKDRRKKQKAKERAEDDETDQETAGGKGLEESGKGKDEKERSSVLEKQSEKKEEGESSSSEEDEEEKNNSTVIIRRRRNVPGPSDGVQRYLNNNGKQSAKVENRAPEDAYVLPTDAIKRVKRNTVEMVKSKEINDGVQLPIDKKPTATAAPSH
uniref:Uncharacterized protein n=1 Tax=Caenorhabditis japonica TaxID=281687 RepID=A0A8R1DII2_CAEJA